MKIRTDFVTNSSSSSFILAFKDKQDGINQISAMRKDYGSNYVDIILSDFESEEPVPYDQIIAQCRQEFGWIADFFLDFGEGGWWSGDKDTFEKRWMDAHPGASTREYRQSEERKAESEKLTDQYLEEFISRVGDRRYLVSVEYCDDDDIGSALEHEILPNCNFTMQRFSHH